MTKTLQDEQRRKLNFLVPLLIFGANAAFVVLCHSLCSDYLNHASSSSSLSSPSIGNIIALVERLKEGPDSLLTLDKVFFFVLLLLAFELLNYITENSGHWFNSKHIPVRGAHLDELSRKDLLFICISKAGTAPFVYFYLRYAYFEPNVPWSLDKVTLANSVLPLAALFVVYDFFYTLFHLFLHLKWIYAYIHKHHHHQKAPSRANNDAVNVHPFEFVIGEYNHLFTLFLCCRMFGMQIHVVGSVLFLALGGFLAGLNHTRFDIEIRVPFVSGEWIIYDTKWHDVHHRRPQSNYGQYSMLWDTIFGTYRPYNPTDRIKPKMQLDPATGKSFEYMARMKQLQ